jgi:hypothetical protein
LRRELSIGNIDEMNKDIVFHDPRLKCFGLVEHLRSTYSFKDPGVAERETQPRGKEVSRWRERKRDHSPTYSRGILPDSRGLASTTTLEVC